MPLRNPFDFTGKTVVLAGATGGLGRPISVAFAAGGANIAACARSEQALADLAAEMRGAGINGEVMTAKVDLTVEHEVHGFVDAVRAKFGTIDILATLVGGIIRKPSWQQAMDVNLKTCWLACQAVGRVTIAQRQGRIMVIPLTSTLVTM